MRRQRNSEAGELMMTSCGGASNRFGGWRGLPPRRIAVGKAWASNQRGERVTCGGRGREPVGLGLRCIEARAAGGTSGPDAVLGDKPRRIGIAERQTRCGDVFSVFNAIGDVEVQREDLRQKVLFR